ncbi:MAG: flagellar basal body-associated FliL family protein [Armatimonadetes bacterium]|nr:flagellar basal body-associated FliL family protein [Armatimonadota bacterium]
MRMTDRGKLPIMIIAIALIVVLAAGAGVFVLKGKGHGKKGEAKENKPHATMPLGEFVVNLADQGELRYLKANIVLAVEGDVPSSGGHGGESGPSPAVRDAVIEVLSSKRFTELTQPGGKEKLKKEIVTAVNERLEGCKAVDVYFSDFAMQ